MMVQMPHSFPNQARTTNSTRDQMPRSRRTSTIISHFQLTHTTRDQRLELSSNGFHSVHHSAAEPSTSPITTVSQLNSESNIATTTVPNEETSLSKIDEKIKKLWQINNQYFIFIHSKLNKIIII